MDPGVLAAAGAVLDLQQLIKDSEHDRAALQDSMPLLAQLLEAHVPSPVRISVMMSELPAQQAPAAALALYMAAWCGVNTMAVGLQEEEPSKGVMRGFAQVR